MTNLIFRSLLVSLGKEEDQTNTKGNDANTQQDIQDEKFPIHFLTLFLRLSYEALLSFLIALPDLNLFRLTKPLVRFITYPLLLKAKMYIMGSIPTVLNMNRQINQTR